MTGRLSSKELAFLTQMSESAEQERHGFQLILKKYRGTDQLVKFFDELFARGFFEAQRNPAPEPVDDEGYFRIPYWPALDYLLALAETAGRNGDLNLAKKVLSIIRNVSTFGANDKSYRENYHTAHQFAAILGLLPTSEILGEDLKLIPIWLHGQFEMGLVSRAISQGVFVRMLTSEHPEDWRKAFHILRYCTEVLWVDRPGFLGTRQEPVIVIDDSSLQMLIEQNTSDLGKKIGKEASTLFVERLSEVFDPTRRNVPSWVLRPAIEDHPQNHAWRVAENRLIVGLRDTLLSWLGHDPEEAKTFIWKMLVDGPVIVRRICIYIVSLNWDTLKGLYPTVLAPEFFDFEYLHETYSLLKEHFSGFSPRDKKEVVKVIRNLPAVHDLSESHLHLMARQRDWLSAVVEQGCSTADKWYMRLTADASLGPIADHPDFNAWSETYTGQSTSPFQPDEIVSFAQSGNIVERLNGFEQVDPWRGPTVRELVKSLEEAVQIRPDLFLPLLPAFLKADIPYQYGIINGFKRLWETSIDDGALQWDAIWENLLTFFEAIVKSPDYREQTVLADQGLLSMATPNKEWTNRVIVDFLGAATRDDWRACPVSLLIRGWALIINFLDHVAPTDTMAAEPMSQALNSPKGRVLDTLYRQALRICRVCDEEKGSHEQAWVEMQRVFDAELSRCKDGNYEFSTLTGYYAANFEYLAPDWFSAHIGEIFPSTIYRDNLLCALDGLIYAQKTLWLYRQLAATDVVDMALRIDVVPWAARQNILDMLAHAYLWGDEELQSPRFTCLFLPSRVPYLQEISRFFWSIRGQQLVAPQVARIMEFWSRAVDWAFAQEESQSELFSSLAPLTCYLQIVGEREQRLLVAVAPFVASGKNGDLPFHLFIEQLDRLVDCNLREIEEVLRKVLKAYTPRFDFQDHLKSIIRKLAKSGMVKEARDLANQLRDLPGVSDLWCEIGVKDTST